MCWWVPFDLIWEEEADLAPEVLRRPIIARKQADSAQGLSPTSGKTTILVLIFLPSFLPQGQPPHGCVPYPGEWDDVVNTAHDTPS